MECMWWERRGNCVIFIMTGVYQGSWNPLVHMHKELTHTKSEIRSGLREILLYGPNRPLLLISFKCNKHTSKIQMQYLEKIPNKLKIYKENYRYIFLPLTSVFPHSLYLAYKNQETLWTPCIITYNSWIFMFLLQ